ncbi:hypothetical protein [Sphingomonas prati]|uniref:Uncharacterized protein n=1 Tax=Sphingomonas prati TaxID=1843237 RepID=A0A7W9F307_9SPHN|nr:hypothetical protein [Sphingomonas prati]MBB5729005.1 hypothetical protein [Sphingomonas prati]GGE85794.1 hypothetical protein GCM10011404_18270 [Sphingomonas prati]
MLLFLTLLAVDPVQTAATPASEPKKICRRDMTTGSIMPKRTCRTQAEWAAIERSNDDAWDATRRKMGFTQRGTGRLE